MGSIHAATGTVAGASCARVLGGCSYTSMCGGSCLVCGLQVGPEPHACFDGGALSRETFFLLPCFSRNGNCVSTILWFCCALIPCSANLDTLFLNEFRLKGRTSLCLCSVYHAQALKCLKSICCNGTLHIALYSATACVQYRFWCWLLQCLCTMLILVVAILLCLP